MIGTKFISKNGKVWTIDNKLSESYVLTSIDGQYLLIRYDGKNDFDIQSLIDHQDDLDMEKKQISEELFGDDI